MSTLLSTQHLSKAFGSQLLFDDLSFSLLEGDRVGLIGPNGAGKSTLLKILIGQEEADEGEISQRQGLRIGYASQSPVFSSKAAIDTVVEGIAIDEREEALLRARILLTRAEFTDTSIDSSKLSGGWKKRLDLIRALINEPDLFLLDEPTNHLDLEGILWLEKFLEREKTTLLIVSHDRQFLQNVCNKIFDLNPCYPEGVFVSEGNLESFYEKKQLFLEGQLERERSLKNSVKDEIDWLRRSPKARTTKSRSRVSRAQSMIEELAHVKSRNQKPRVSISFYASERQTQKLIFANNLTKSLGDKQLFKGVDLLLSPGTRLGIVGKNGTGKSTLLKILSQQIPPDMGTVKYADDLKLVYFDQHREQIPLDLTLKEALCESGDTVNYMGQQIHVNGWAARFLFPPERLSMPVRCLSGGERARILIAKLMLKPADVLFLDEPTNDLDIPTLEVLEESLKTFAGAVVLISHDRHLMDGLCTQILSLGCSGDPQLYNGYSQWESAQRALKKEEKIAQDKATLPSPSQPPSKKKLSYMEQKELDGMEKAIEEADKDIHKILNDIEKAKSSIESVELYQKLAQAQEKIDKLFHRWEELSNRQKGL